MEYEMPRLDGLKARLANLPPYSEQAIAIRRLQLEACKVEALRDIAQELGAIQTELVSAEVGEFVPRLAESLVALETTARDIRKTLELLEARQAQEARERQFERKAIEATNRQLSGQAPDITKACPPAKPAPDIDTAKRALVKLQQARPSSHAGWSQEECELMAEAMTALFPGEGGEREHWALRRELGFEE